MSTPIWFVNILKRFFPARYRLAKLTNIPGVGKIIDNALFKGDQIIYLPKDDLINSLNITGEYENIVLPSEIVEYFIEKSRFHWIMDFCICREGDDCHSFPKDLGCLFLGESVLKINHQLGRLVSREEALNHVERCREAGLVHMIGRNKLDSVWLGAGPSDKLLTICNCCPCCCLWRMIPDLNPMIAGKVSRMPGIHIYVNENCVGCGQCVQGVCFVEAIKLIHDRAIIIDECKGCGRCIDICPNQAIVMEGIRTETIKETIESIDPLVSIV